MNKLFYWLSVCGLIMVGVAGCNSGTTDQNMPVGGSFYGTLTPSVGCTTVGAESVTTEAITFSVSESGPTIIYDTTNPLQLNPPGQIISGTFQNPINQNTNCYSGSVTNSRCRNIQNATIVFSSCSLVQTNNSTIFRGVYTITAPGYVQQGNIYGQK
jgi:hypothetical protein